jgi:hypothetical protein
MNRAELQKYQFEFEKNLKVLRKELKSITKLRDAFVKDYPLERIEKLTLEEYVIGNQSKESFCYRIEKELNDWGNIHGSTSTKFGVYFGKYGDDTKKAYRIGKGAFGTTLDEAFERVKLEIQELLLYRQGDNYDKLKANLISPMFKGKILSLYFPDEFLNIYSQKHLNHFINGLKLNSTSRAELDKQKLLMDFKNSDQVMKKWSTHEFGRFLYMVFKTPNNDVNNKDISKGLRSLNTKEFPPIESVKPQTIETQLDTIPPSKKNKNKSRKGKLDYEKKNEDTKKIGDRGEQIVLKYEIEQLRVQKKNKLAKKVEMVSLMDDMAGYDILSYFPDGRKKLIEVKATVRSIGYSSFYISANEYKISMEKNNYYIYFVYDAHTKAPKISIFDTSSFWKEENVRVEPNSFKVTIKTGIE